MSEYSFKNLSDVETVTEPAEDTTVMGFQNGTPIQMPMGAIKTENTSGVFLINLDDPEYDQLDPAYGNKIKEALLAGKPVWVYGTLPTRSGEPVNYGYHAIDWFSLEYKTMTGGDSVCLAISYYNDRVITFVISA